MSIESLSDITRSGVSAFGAGGGDVVGPASSIDGQLAQFDSTSGKLLKTGPKLTISTTAPSSPVIGDLWVDTN